MGGETASARGALTKRQREVLELAARGLTNAEVADVLEISAATVKIHMAAVYRALDVTNRTEAAMVLAQLESEQQTSTAGDVEPRPRAVAVLPFEAVARERTRRHLGNGLAQELIHRLSHWRWFPVVAFSSTHGFNVGQQGVASIGRELGAGYVVEGSVRSSSERVRITARLIQARQQTVLWSENYDREIGDIFVVQDEISRAIASALHPKLVQCEGARYRVADPTNLDAWELAMRGLHHLDQRTRVEQERAAQCFNAALDLEPNNLPALFGRALAHYNQVFFQWAADPAHCLAELHAGADLAYRLAPDDAHALLIRGVSFMVRGEIDSAVRALRSAIDKNPSAARAYSFLGQLLSMQGRDLEGIERLEEAIRLSPCHPMRFAMDLCVALCHFGLGDYEAAYARLQIVLDLQEEEPLLWAALASTCGHLGRSEEARLALERLRSLYPGYRPTELGPITASIDPSRVERFNQGLRKAGFREL